MKRIVKYLAITALVTFTYINTMMAQPPPPPPGGSGSFSGNQHHLKEPAGAPVGDGLLILGILAALYAGKKIYGLYKENKEEPLPAEK